MASSSSPTECASGSSVSSDADSEKLVRMTAACRTLIECLGEDPDREGLAKTPLRMSRALLDLTSGYSRDPAEVVGDALFACASTEMVVVKDVPVFSLCEHHMLPFFGSVHIAYKPLGKVLGLSKFARRVMLFSQRLQIQERLTAEVCEALQRLAAPAGVAVLVECTHLCMAMRGVEKPAARTVTTAFTGVFCADAGLRAEFIALASAPPRS